MDPFPFHIKPVHLGKDEANPINIDQEHSIPLSTEPVSLEKDLHGKVTLSSKYAAVDFEQFVQTLFVKDVGALVAERGKEDIVLPTDIILELSRSHDLVVMGEEEKKQYWPVPALLGFLLGAAVLIIFDEDISTLLWVTIALAAFCGSIVGFIWQKFYDARLKGMVREWAREIAED